MLYEGVPVDECGGCRGIWLDDGELRSIVKIRQKLFSKAEISKVRAINEQFFKTTEPLDSSLDCPKCGSKMGRINYAGSTGIAIDKCDEHGIWCDAEELEHIQMCVEEWEKKLGDDIKQYGPILEKVRAENERRLHAATAGKVLKRSPVLRFFLEMFDG